MPGDGGFAVVSGVITFEHEADPSSQVAQFKCSLRSDSPLNKFVQRQLRVAGVVWPVVFGLIFCLVLLVISGSVVPALVASGVYVLVHYATGHIPYFAKSQRRSYERHLLKKVERMAKENPSLIGRWRFTISPEAVEFENLTNGSVVVTKMRSIERAELVDGHLCLFVQGEVTGSVPLEGMESQAQVECFRHMLSEAGAEGWPRGAPGSVQRTQA